MDRDDRIGTKFLRAWPDYEGHPGHRRHRLAVRRPPFDCRDRLRANERQQALLVEKIENDMRESPAIAICQSLGSSGHRRGRLAAQGHRGAALLCRRRVRTLAGSQALVLLTKWNLFRNLDLDRINQTLLSTCFFDLRNIYKREKVEKAGLSFRKMRMDFIHTQEDELGLKARMNMLPLRAGDMPATWARRAPGSSSTTLSPEI
jgi:UDPglucose 6-dehydrogenase